MAEENQTEAEEDQPQAEEDQTQGAGIDPSHAINEVEVELTVVLGKAAMPIEHLLRMGRGAIIELSTMIDDDVWILVNNRVIARGQVMISGERLAVAITESVTPVDYTA